MKIHLKPLTLLVVVLSCSFAGCDSDDDKKNPSIISTSNPDAVSDGLDVPNGTKTQGTMPMATNDEGGPEIEDNSSVVYTVAGARIVFQTFVISGDAVGFNFKVNGAKDYYIITPVDPPISNGRAGRKKIVSPYFYITIPEKITPGEFCVSYNVFDTQSRISNTVSRCIRVGNSPGENSAFLSANTWSAISTHQVILQEGIDAEKIIGELEQTEQAVGVFCNGIPSNINVEIQNKTEFIYLTFHQNGEYIHQEKFYLKTVDLEKSGCDPVYKVINSTIELKGHWFYDSALKELFLIRTSQDEGTVVTMYAVTTTNEGISLKNEYSDVDYFETRYQPKP